MNTTAAPVAGENVIIKPDGKILLKNVILSYPNLFEPFKGRTAKPEDKAKYSAKFLLSKDTHKADIQKLGKHIVEMCVKEFKSKLPSDKIFLRNGETTGKDEDVPFFIVSASETLRPVVYGREGPKGPPVSKEDADTKAYAGCIVNALIQPWTQNNTFGKRVNANLLAVQFVKDGKRMGRAQVDTSGDFEDISSEFGDDVVLDDAFGDDEINFEG